MAPFEIISEAGKVIGYLVFLLIGMGFGAALELSGFGDSRKLAAQFYFKDMTVLKVMFTGIIVAMLLIFFSSSVEILDFDRVWVNHTYLVPGIIGGFVMGIGFIIGGFCPGTSVVALSTFKIDGLFFVTGVAFGVFLFGETVGSFTHFFHSTFMGRFILPELFGIKAGYVVIIIIFMAISMFYGAEIAEQYFGQKKSIQEISFVPPKKLIGSAGALVAVAIIISIIGQPTVADKWEWIKAKEMKKINSRDIYIHPGELLEVMNDPLLSALIIDVRSESDYNIFHLENSKRVTNEILHNSIFIKQLLEAPSNTVFVILSNGEKNATDAYKILRAQKVINLYILDGGINNWLDIFCIKPEIAVKKIGPLQNNEELAYVFSKAVGSSIHSSNPGRGTVHLPELKFVKKVKIQKKKISSGGCG